MKLLKLLFFLILCIPASAQIQLGADIDGEASGDFSGTSVSLSSDGTIVAIGATYNNGTGSYGGHVRIYEYIAGSWTQLGADIDGEASGDYSGQSLSLSSDGTIVAIGSINNDGIGTDAGHVRIYEYSAGSWTQLGADIDGEASGDYSGQSVSLSSDGTTVAIGATENDDIGSNAGHVRIYEYSAGSWTQLGADIDGEAASDRSGTSASLSSDGTTVAIGAINNDGNGVSAGHVRVYSLAGNTAGVYSTTLEHNLKIYPIPTISYLCIEVPQNMIGQSYSLEVKNSIGQSMFEVRLNQPLVQINFNSFGAAGSYTLSIKDSGGNVVDTRVIILQ
jgi:hypothetical protein